MEDKKEKPTTALVVNEKNISDNVLMRVSELEKTGGLQIPSNYSAANALKSAWLMLQTVEAKDGDRKVPALSVCTKESVANTLLDMVIQGLSPAKKQCYFIAYGKQLQLSRSYMGTIAVTKRLKGVKDVFANIIYEGDEFEYTFDLETGLKKIIKHNQSFQNIDTKKILGAYAIIIRDSLPPFIEIMNMGQIRAAWEQGKANGNSGAHNKFTDEMAKKSVINRACKTFWNTSDDSDLLIDVINKTTDMENIPSAEILGEETIEQEISENANKELIDINPIEKKEPEQTQQPEPEMFSDAWESPIKILAMIDELKDYKAAVNFANINEQRLSSFPGRDGEAIEKAMNDKIQKLKEASQPKNNNKKSPY